jgi:hypothetical protein
MAILALDAKVIDIPKGVRSGIYIFSIPYNILRP